MASPRNYQTQAVIIKEARLGEIDKIITFYTPEFGKLRAVAKGACRPRSKLGGNVAPLTYSLMMLARGRNLDIATQSQNIEAFQELKGDLWRMACGLYILDLVDSFTVENDENRPLFDLLLDSLRWLCQDDDSRVVLRYFELHLLDCLGYRPQLYRCVICNSVIKPVRNFFSFGQGGVLCPDCSEQDITASSISLDALKVLRLWQNCDYATAKRVILKSELASELEQVTQGYTTYLLQRKLKSMDWLHELGRTAVDKSNTRN